MSDKKITPVTLKFNNSFLEGFKDHLDAYNQEHGTNLKRASLMKHYVEETVEFFESETHLQFAHAISLFKNNPDLLELVEVWIEQNKSASKGS